MSPAQTSGLRTQLTHDVADAATVDRAVLGGKGAGLVEMTRQGLIVPPAFVLSTACCQLYFDAGRLPEDLAADVDHRILALEEHTGRSFGGPGEPLLLSVRSGAPISMPGMMDTVLNLGLDRSAAIELARRSGSARFMADVLARFHAMYAEIVLDALEIPESPVEEILDRLGADPDPGEVFDAVWSSLQDSLREAGEDTVPEAPREQLLRAIEAVFRSWNTRRAIAYRDLHEIDHAMGTAVVVQTMVFGNRDQDSGSGVVFSRDPVTGEPGLYGEYLAASQGEDVVAGIRTPDPVASLAANQPEVYRELAETVARLEAQYLDVLDIEFTVESGILYFLQVRSAKRTAPAAVRFGADFLREHGDAAAGILRTITLDHLRDLSRPTFSAAGVAAAEQEGRRLAVGIGASPGHVSGVLALDPDRAVELAGHGDPVILARAVTSPTDLHGMIAGSGVVTATGGATSHAAVVARALSKTCVVGCQDLEFAPDGGNITVAGRTLREGDRVSLDGEAGVLYLGDIPVEDLAESSADLDEIARYCRDRTGVDLFVRAATPQEVDRAREIGATGVVVAAVDALATSTTFAEVMAEIRGSDSDAQQFRGLEDVLAEGFAPLFGAADGLAFGVRAVDFLADETAEVLEAGSTLVTHPDLVMPLGTPELIAAHLRGLGRARAAAGGEVTAHLSARNVSDPAEAEALARLAREHEDTGIAAGAYIASPRGALAVRSIAEHLDLQWVELRLLQAAMFGLPPQVLLSPEPLDAYAQTGLISVNPRREIDPSVLELIERIAEGGVDPGIGIRVSGRADEHVLQQVWDLGFRRIAVDFLEAAPSLLALARATL